MVGLRRQRPGELETLAIEQRQRACQRIRPVQHARSVEGVEGGVTRRAAAMAAGERGADEDVFVGRQALERARDLGGAGEPHAGASLRAQSRDVLAVDLDGSAVDGEVAGDEVEQRRLAGAVWSDDADGASHGNGERDVIDDASAERLDHLVHGDGVGGNRRLAIQPSPGYLAGQYSIGWSSPSSGISGNCSLVTMLNS